MKVFIVSVVVAIIIASGAEFVLTRTFGEPAEIAFASSTARP